MIYKYINLTEKTYHKNNKKEKNNKNQSILKILANKPIPNNTPIKTAATKSLIYSKPKTLGGSIDLTRPVSSTSPSNQDNSPSFK